MLKLSITCLLMHMKSQHCQCFISIGIFSFCLIKLGNISLSLSFKKKLVSFNTGPTRFASNFGNRQQSITLCSRRATSWSPTESANGICIWNKLHHILSFTGSIRWHFSIQRCSAPQSMELGAHAYIFTISWRGCNPISIKLLCCVLIPVSH